MENLIKFLGNLQSYFNDFIGAVAPAIVMVAGLLAATPLELPTQQVAAWGDMWWLVVVVGLFAIGHILTGLSEVLRKCVPRSFGFKLWTGVKDETANNSAYLALREYIRTKGFPTASAELSFNGVRNIAMTLSADGQELGRRFMFLALFCYGTATAILIVGITQFGYHIVNRAVDLAAVVLFVGSVFVWWLLVRRGAEFEIRAQTVPFATALAEVIGRAIGLRAAANESRTTTAPAAS